MALYLPHQHIVLDVIDDPCSSPVEADAFPNLTVVPVTCAQMGQDVQRGRIARAIAEARLPHARGDAPKAAAR